MASLTIRNIPDELLDKIRTLSQIERRSINNEILMILERGLREALSSIDRQSLSLSKDIQISLWRNMSGKWQDTRSTDEIKADIYESRSPGREVDL